MRAVIDAHGLPIAKRLRLQRFNAFVQCAFCVEHGNDDAYGGAIARLGILLPAYSVPWLRVRGSCARGHTRKASTARRASRVVHGAPNGSRIGVRCVLTLEFFGRFQNEFQVHAFPRLEVGKRHLAGIERRLEFLLHALQEIEP